jgi:Tol biopolymer transport system component
MRLLQRSLVFLAFFFFASAVLYAQDDYYHPELQWHTIETKHFFVHFHDGEERTAQVVARVAEDIYGPVTSLYHHEPDQKVNFVIKDYDDFSNGGAYFFDNKIEIWASALDFDLRGSHNWLRNVVTHEFTHVVQIQTSMKFGRHVPAIYLQWLGYQAERRTDVLYGYPNVIVSYPISGYDLPSWLAEGIAQFNRKELHYDSWDSHRDMILRMYALDGNMLTWNEMSVFGKTSLGNESSYNAGFAFVHYIAERYGDDKLEKISRSLTSLTTITVDDAIKSGIGKNAEDLYNEWRDFLHKDYTERTAKIKDSLVAGHIIADVGFGNLYPQFSSDGKSIAYISNKHSDYFGLAGLYLYNTQTKEEKLIKDGVHSNFGWSATGDIIYYTKSSRHNSFWSDLFDVYSYDTKSGDEKRLTHSLRANAPAISPDGSTIAFVSGHDGTLNIWSMNSDGTNIRQLTHYMNGEQVFNPKWSPDSKEIIFDYSIKDGRDIAMIPFSTDTSMQDTVQYLIATPNDERNAIFTPDGKAIVYSSDESGIFNIYRYNLETKETTRLTNVLGGAFMPTVNAEGKLAFATYTSTGYKIALLDTVLALQGIPSYADTRTSQYYPPVDSVGIDSNKAVQFDWKSLRAYNDFAPVEQKVTGYTNNATSVTFIPFLRVDNYNPKNTGLETLKPGLYLFSYDMLDRYGFFAGADANSQGERDLFFNFDYRGKIPGLFQLGLDPALSLEAYNITRNANARIGLGIDTEGVGVGYDLLEFDAALKNRFITENMDWELRYAHSRYTSSIGTFTLPQVQGPSSIVQASSFLYLIGNDLSMTLNYEFQPPSRTEDINPVGRKVRIRYDYEFNKFDPNSAESFDQQSGLYLPVYQSFNFHRLEGMWREEQPLPGWDHVLTAQVRGGTIFGPTVDEFFDFYIGGLAGMKGYPYYSLGGNRYAYGTLTYRFPLLEHIDKRVLQLYFDKLYGAVFGDAGNVWGATYTNDPNYKYDAGAELRLQAFSWYAFPTSVFFDATYGFDSFNQYVTSTSTWVTYGKEWNFHFGILFGFDLDSD